MCCSPWGWKELGMTEQLSNKGFQTPPVPMILICWDPKTILVNTLLHSGLICREASGFPFGGGHAHTPLSPQASVWRCSSQQFSDFALRTVLSVGPFRLHPGPGWGETIPGPHHTIPTVTPGAGAQQDHSLPSLAPRNQEQVFVSLGQQGNIWKRAGTRFGVAWGGEKETFE